MKLVLLILLGLVLTQAAQFHNRYFMDEEQTAEEYDEGAQEFLDMIEDEISPVLSTKQFPYQAGVVEDYDLQLAEMLAGFCQIAYCKAKHIEKWNCHVCKKYPGMTDIVVMKNGALRDNHAFMGYYEPQNLIVAIYKGSITIRNWLEDFDFFKTKYPYCEGCEVHEGFYKGYNGLQDQFWQNYSQLREKYPTARLVISGHSLGGALSVANAGDLLEKGVTDFLWYNYGCPRVGNEAFANWLQNGIEQRCYRVTHHKDPVPHLPLEAMGFHHVAQEVFYPGNSAPGEEHIMCNMSGEDPECSDRYALDANILNHLQYEGWDFLVNIGRCLIF